jgi:hypothetical protein
LVGFWCGIGGLVVVGLDGSDLDGSDWIGYLEQIAA